MTKYSSVIIIILVVLLLQYALEQMGIRTNGILLKNKLASFSRTNGNSNKWEDFLSVCAEKTKWEDLRSTFVEKQATFS